MFYHHDHDNSLRHLYTFTCSLERFVLLSLLPKYCIHLEHSVLKAFTNKPRVGTKKQRLVGIRFTLEDCDVIMIVSASLLAVLVRVMEIPISLNHHSGLEYKTK